MFLLGRPPTLRWVVAALVLAGAVWLDLRPPPTERHPFAARDVAAGETIGTGDVEMRQVLRGSLPSVRLPVVAGRHLEAGDPVLDTDLAADAASVPDGWWALPLDLPAGATPGTVVGVVLLDGATPQIVEGVVTRAAVDEGFGEGQAVVALPADQAVRVARAVTAGETTVMTSVRGG